MPQKKKRGVKKRVKIFQYVQLTLNVFIQEEIKTQRETVLPQIVFHLQNKTKSVASNGSENPTISFKTLKLPQELKGLPVVHLFESVKSNIKE